MPQKYIHFSKFCKCLSLGFIAVKRQHDRGNSYKGQHLIGAGLQQSRKHNNMQAGMVVENK
jgi:hypothetical protein